MGNRNWAQCLSTSICLFVLLISISSRTAKAYITSTTTPFNNGIKTFRSNFNYLPVIINGSQSIATVTPSPTTPSTTIIPTNTPTLTLTPTITPTFTATPSPTTTLLSLFESVLYMPNDAGSATIDDNSSVDLGVGENEDFSIEAFFYTPDLSYEAEHVDVLARKNKCFSFYIQFNSEEPDKLFFTITILGYGEILLWNETNIQVGWHHVAAVFDNEYTADEDAFTIFLDGVRVAHSPDEDIHVDWTPGIPNSTSPLEIGGVWGGHAGFNGYLEEIRISDIVRYSGLTYAIPTTPFSSDANTRALWHFDESPGSSVFMDDSSYGNNLTGHDGAQTYTP